MAERGWQVGTPGKSKLISGSEKRLPVKKNRGGKDSYAILAEYTSRGGEVL